MTLALVTDSNSQIPAVLRERFDVSVVPLIIVVDGEQYREGVDLTTDEFYARLGAGATVSTAAPSPGDVVAVYNAAIERGATEIVSIHVGSNTSATCNAVQIAARACPMPVEVVDTGTASFAIACCVWAAAEARAEGADGLAAADAARRTAGDVDNVFVVGALDLARRGGRLAPGVKGAAGDDDGIPVLALSGGRMQAVGRVNDVEGAVHAMTAYVVDGADGRAVRVGVGDALTADLATAFADALRARPEVAELVHYEIGPSVGAHTGAGTVGACFFTDHRG